MVKVTGKVNEIAASGSVPNKPIKKVSIKLNDINVIIPTNTWVVIFFNVGAIGAVSKLAVDDIYKAWSQNETAILNQYLNFVIIKTKLICNDP